MVDERFGRLLFSDRRMEKRRRRENFLNYLVLITALLCVFTWLSTLIGFFLNTVSYNDVKVLTALLPLFLFLAVVSIFMIAFHHNARFYENGILLPTSSPHNFPEITFSLPSLCSERPLTGFIHKLFYDELTKVVIINNVFIVFCYQKKHEKKEHFIGAYLDDFDVDIEKFRTLVGEKTTIKNIDVDTMVEAGHIIRDIKEYGLCVLNDPRYD